MPDTTTATCSVHEPYSASPAADTRHDAYLSVNQLSTRYSVHYTTVWRWVREAGFPRPVRFSPNCTRWRLCDVQSWEESRFGEGVR